MKDKKRNCLVFLVLFICLTVCAQSSDEVKAMRNLRDYYTQNINTYDINQNMGKWDLYLKQLSEEGQFADLAAYEKKIHDNNWLSSVSFQDQQDIGFYLADTFRRLWVIANHYRQTNVNDIPERFWKSILMMYAQVLGRTYDMLSALSTAAVMFIWNNPYVLYNSGFLLSFCAIMGIAVVLPALKRVFLPDRPQSNHAEKRCFIDTLRDTVKASFLTSFSVTAATLPVILNCYYEFPLYSVFLSYSYRSGI